MCNELDVYVRDANRQRSELDTMVRICLIDDSEPDRLDTRLEGVQRQGRCRQKKSHNIQ